MATQFGGLAARLATQTRLNLGTSVLYLERSFQITSKKCSEVEAGLSFLSRNKLQAYSAQADPRAFHFSPRDFTIPASVSASQVSIADAAAGTQGGAGLLGPGISEGGKGMEAASATGIRAPAPPVEGSIITYQGRDYQAGHVAWEVIQGVPVTYTVYAYRVLMEVFPCVAFTLWLPKTMGELTDTGTLAVRDVSYMNVGAVQAFLIPMDETELAMVTGVLDARTNRAITTVLLPQRSVLVNQITNEAWAVMASSETFPAPTLLAALVRHLPKLPQGLIQAMSDQSSGAQTAGHS